ncbi:GntR family transcriptional regulator [Pseudoroseicyclus tamaricis]|uniref:GntR family transcriptional regulator n=1 Tax=Pseudoroseicyclus tamaricis TaxID=2705421 RepID=A0A6B2JXJ6_9RHOB|nr:GntR family transcriptional regulator [Pseudoroseicyclus tamaricis]NDV01329.1 GntR family transcriptional regulator [Pseudoroseicyclus tamaricis]
MSGSGDNLQDGMQPDSADPLHSQLRRFILEQIRTGEWQPHARIASERELCDRFGVSRTTARRAILDLVHQGELYPVAGKGTFVADRPLRQELRPLVGFDEDLRSQGLVTRSQICDFRRIEADTDLARSLGVGLHSPVILLRRLRLLRDQPLAIQTSFLPEHLCPGLMRLDFNGRSLYRTLREQYGLDLMEGTTVITAALASEEEAGLLKLKPPAAVLRTSQMTQLATGEVIEKCESSFNGGLFELTSAAGRLAPVNLFPTPGPGPNKDT